MDNIDKPRSNPSPKPSQSQINKFHVQQCQAQMRWRSPDVHLTFTWRSPDIHLMFTWNSPDIHLTIIWPSPDPYQTLTKPWLGDFTLHLKFPWTSPDAHLVFTWDLPDHLAIITDPTSVSSFDVWRLMCLTKFKKPIFLEHQLRKKTFTMPWQYGNMTWYQPAYDFRTAFESLMYLEYVTNKYEFNTEKYWFLDRFSTSSNSSIFIVIRFGSLRYEI